MNGKYLLDTNAIIALLDGNNTILKLLSDADWVGRAFSLLKTQVF